MYIFSWTRHVDPAKLDEGAAAAVEIAALTTQVLGHEVSAWMTVASPDAGLLVWSSIVPSLADLAAGNQKLAASEEYRPSIEPHLGLFEGPAEHSLIRIVHGAPDFTTPVGFTFVTTGRCVPGKAAEGMAAAAEIADRLTAITGTTVVVSSPITGPFGTVRWHGGLPDIAAMDVFLAAVDADPDFGRLVDRTAPCFVPGTQSTWYQRLG